MNANGMAEPGDCIVAGVSGGADSVCMLHLLARLQKEIPFRLAVVHVNHGLRAEAGEDAVFVEKLCGQWGIPFYLREVDMAGYAATHRLSLLPKKKTSPKFLPSPATHSVQMQIMYMFVTIILFTEQNTTRFPTPETSLW